MLATASLSLLLLAAPPAGRSAAALLAEVSLDADDYGERIYQGSAWPLQGPRDAPRFVYERRVSSSGGTLRSSSLARDAARVVLIDVAEHSADYVLEQFTEYQFQVGEVRQVLVRGDAVELRVTDARGVRVARERVELPVVVAPTFYGFVARHWQRLLEGQTVAFRYAVVERLQTLGFELTKVAAPAGLVRVQMKASNPIVALFVAPIVVTWTDAGVLVSYEGRVPMKLGAPGAWRDLDAHVEYSDLATTFR